MSFTQNVEILISVKTTTLVSRQLTAQVASTGSNDSESGECSATQRLISCSSIVMNTACSKWVGLSRTVLFDKSSWESSRLLCDVFCTLHVPRSQIRRVHYFACATKIVMNVRLLWGLCMGILKLLNFCHCGICSPLRSNFTAFVSVGLHLIHIRLDTILK